ncbi:hypothetical protein ACFO25_12920 [Paenactinomyces guangxiensis]|uniref:Uncharacterized protein n=1 Tax=Paenactinomyces guangxiensis TaxID=1490290 RepID=A0A7W1WRB0_9BACL|nr:hypothetical protein [Paenactinomyces guangxiensis]MBA4494637.1 hypothetical protein [Paenactinomyces guangxiensis]MBH8591600.1 hypothetical protein [Paenactinomyces guangxiensis]
MLQGDEYYDNERMEFLKKDFEVSVHFSVGSSQKGKNPVYRMEIAPRSGEPVFEDKIEFNGTGLFIPLPVEQWKDGTYIIRLFRDNRLTAKRTFRLVSHMPWWQKYFPWTEKLFQ